jgi:RNA polymerase sigma-70 factor (ECF subfamily)
MAQEDQQAGAADDLAALMARYQAGDGEAFERLYARLAPRLRRYLRSLARDPGWAEDLLQETFLHLHRARHTYDCRRPLEPWAYAITRHVFLMSRRARVRRGELDWIDGEMANQQASPAPESGVIAWRRSRRPCAGR